MNSSHLRRWDRNCRGGSSWLKKYGDFLILLCPLKYSSSDGRNNRNSEVTSDGHTCWNKTNVASKAHSSILYCLATSIDWRQPTHTHTHTQQLKLSSVSNTPGNVFLLWGSLSGVVHWSQPSVINCHNASKLTNGLCVKEGPLIYWPPLVDPEPIISITAGFHVWASSPANPPFLSLTLHRFLGTRRGAFQPRYSFGTCEQTHAVHYIKHVKVHALYTKQHIRFACGHAPSV